MPEKLPKITDYQAKMPGDKMISPKGMQGKMPINPAFLLLFCE
jgi:hypothetical protein